ncbi:MAG: SDR family oxidoreductase [Alphaproteobacteria bacterium]|nr:SDR family oxidoreductase [Alphaproteobacteria bacterium]
MKGKVALITGAARGIGRACAVEFASLGANVIIDDLPDEQSVRLLHEVKEMLESKYGVRVLAVPADISVEASVRDLFAQSVAEFGRIDIVVNNAGIAIDKDWDDHTVEDWRRSLDNNLIGTWLVSKYFGGHMAAMGGGSIVNISSTNGIDAVSPFSVGYDASKAGIINLTKNLARQFAPSVRVNSVAPDWVDTDMNKDLAPEYMAGVIEKVALKRIAQPAEIAKIVRFLASEDASYLNAITIVADGGRA